MRYLLDTNVCVMYLNGRSNKVRDRLISTPREDITVCSIVKSELFYGAMRSHYPVKTLAYQQRFLDQFVSLPFDDESALLFGQVRAKLAGKGTPIGICDLQIAIVALINDLILVTHNTREFERVDGLQIEDWEL